MKVLFAIGFEIEIFIYLRAPFTGLDNDIKIISFDHLRVALVRQRYETVALEETVVLHLRPTNHNKIVEVCYREDTLTCCQKNKII
jgi:hypothetical protein